LHQAGKDIGLYLRPHGFGVEAVLPTVHIDFDWGDGGEATGFDCYRLWRHCSLNNLLQDELTEELLRLRFARACAAGAFGRDRYLHYLHEERTSHGSRPAEPKPCAECVRLIPAKPAQGRKGGNAKFIQQMPDLSDPAFAHLRKVLRTGSA
jgi:hypothetical protein